MGGATMRETAGRTLGVMLACGLGLAAASGWSEGEERTAPPAGGEAGKEAKVNEIKVERSPSQERLAALGVFEWSIWTKEVSKFPWTYDSQESCYFLEGEVVVTPDGGKPVQVGKGDLVIFPKGMSCTWDIRKPVRKHYLFE
jgi:uncharacterized cupin superfamily protein